ncbi:MAG: endonuclease V [Bacteroidota bacterium]
MHLAFDTYYSEIGAFTVAVAFEDWLSEKPSKVYTELLSEVAPYEPGAFYKRELPCILSLLQSISVTQIDTIIVDGYVILDEERAYGLGGYLFKTLEEKVPVIGVAKSPYKNPHPYMRELFRGNSQRPLFISSLGIPLAHATHLVGQMHGDFRMPTLLQILDTTTKQWVKKQKD